MTAKISVWRPGPSVCRCCLTEGCYKDISTEYFCMGKREVYAEMLSNTFDLNIAYLQLDGPNSISRLICEPCISRLRDAADFKRQVAECERTLLQYASSSNFITLELAPGDASDLDKNAKTEIKLEKQDSDDDFDGGPDNDDMAPGDTSDLDKYVQKKIKLEKQDSDNDFDERPDNDDNLDKDLKVVQIKLERMDGDEVFDGGPGSDDNAYLTPNGVTSDVVKDVQLEQIKLEKLDSGDDFDGRPDYDYDDDLTADDVTSDLYKDVQLEQIKVEKMGSDDDLDGGPNVDYDDDQTPEETTASKVKPGKRKKGRGDEATTTTCTDSRRPRGRNAQYYRNYRARKRAEEKELLKRTSDLTTADSVAPRKRKSAAEYQREYRARKKAKKTQAKPSGSVLPSTSINQPPIVNQLTTAGISINPQTIAESSTSGDTGPAKPTRKTPAEYQREYRARKKAQRESRRAAKTNDSSMEQI